MPDPPSADYGHLLHRLTAQGELTADRLARAAARGPAGGHEGRAALDAVRSLLDQLASAAQGVAGRSAACPPLWRAVPQLAEGTLPDALRVLLHDAVEELGRVPADTEVWGRRGRCSARQVAEALVATLTVGCGAPAGEPDRAEPSSPGGSA